MSVKYPPPPISEIASSWKRKSPQAENFIVYMGDDLTGGYNLLPYLWFKRKWNLIALPIVLFALYALYATGDLLTLTIPAVYLAYFIADSLDHWKKKCGKNLKRYKYRPFGNYDKQRTSLSVLLENAYVEGKGWPVPQMEKEMRSADREKWEAHRGVIEALMISINSNGKQYLNSIFWDWLPKNY